MLIPKKVKHRKWHKSAGMSGGSIATRTYAVSFGSFGLKSTTASWVTSRQLEASRRAIMRFIRRGGKVWIRIFPDKPITTKGLAVPMGKGKGAVDHYVTNVRPGTVIFEMDGVDEATAREAFRLAGHKLPVKTKFVVKT